MENSTQELNLLDTVNKVLSVSLDPSVALCHHYTTVMADITSLEALIAAKKEEVQANLNKLGCGTPEQVKAEMNNDLSDYNADASWNEKISYFLKMYKRPLSTRQIADEIIEAEHRDPKDRRRIQSGVSVTISMDKLKKYKKLPDGTYALKSMKTPKVSAVA